MTRATSWVSGVLLAAGRSRRFGVERPKQLAEFEGEALVRRAARRVLESRLDELVVVVGHCAAEVEAALAGLSVKFARNRAYAAGQSTSVRVGVKALDQRASAALFLPCDQLHLQARHLDQLIELWLAEAPLLVVATCKGRRGLPTLFARQLFADLLELEGDEGGRQILGRHEADLRSVELDDPWALVDIDTEADLERLALGGGSSS